MAVRRRVLSVICAAREQKSMMMHTSAAAIIACRNAPRVRKQRRSVRARCANLENYRSAIIVTVNAQPSDNINDMRTSIKTDGIEVTAQMKERLDWICSKLEKMADAKSRRALHCDIIVSQVAGSTDEGEFQVEIRFFDGSGMIHQAKAAAGNLLAALDIAHDEIERKYFEERRTKHEKQKIKDFNSRRVELAKRASEEDAPKKGEEGEEGEEQ